MQHPPQQMLQIPTVTIHHLAAFHHSHLCRLDSSIDACSLRCSPYSGQEDECLEDEEQDDLGYYPDGVKRTLTDEQVAMFRFSEVQQLLKQKLRAEARRKKERDQAEDEKIEAANPVKPVAVSPQEARKNRLEAALWAAKHDWDEFGNPIDAPVEPRQYVAEVQGRAEAGKTFLWPKVGDQQEMPSL